jgi:hypothetical protein
VFDIKDRIGSESTSAGVTALDDRLQHAEMRLAGAEGRAVWDGGGGRVLLLRHPVSTGSRSKTLKAEHNSSERAAVRWALQRLRWTVGCNCRIQLLACTRIISDRFVPHPYSL